MIKIFNTIYDKTLLTHFKPGTASSLNYHTELYTEKQLDKVRWLILCRGGRSYATSFISVLYLFYATYRPGAPSKSF